MILEISPQITMPTPHGIFKMFVFRHSQVEGENSYIYMDDLSEEPPLVRVHSECFTGDILNSKRCDCGEQLEASKNLIAKKGNGVIIYLRQEGRGLGLLNKIKAYELQDQGRDTVEANIELGYNIDNRNYDAASDILKHMGKTKISLLTNNPDKIKHMVENNIECTRVPLTTTVFPENDKYLKTKKEKMAHLI